MLIEFFVKMLSPLYLLFYIYPNVPLAHIKDRQLLVLPPTWADINNGIKSCQFHKDQPVFVHVGVQICTQTFYIRHFPALNNTKPHRIVVGVVCAIRVAGLASIHPSSSIHYHHHHHLHYFLHRFFFYILFSIYWFTFVIWGVMTSKRPWKPGLFRIFSNCTRTFSVFLCNPADEINVGMAGGKGMCFTSQFESPDDRSGFLLLLFFLLTLSVPFQSNLIMSPMPVWVLNC